MRRGASTPEELEMLFEDAFVIHDRDAIVHLFEEEALLVAGEGSRPARGGEEIARFAKRMWDRDYAYLADPKRILRARDTALVVAETGINVVRRGTDGRWRYAISLLDMDTTITKEAQ